ncbi:MAG: ribosome biogenesis GTPase Der [Proteobacteria bacterium]|nr:ribosome biogenesis GTPase Der [Pseudomonadota bacterium]
MKPIVAIVGRPNVGKSTLFNRLTGTRDAIVHNMPGVTRDRNYGDVDWYGKAFTLIDTGGFEPDSDDIILSQMREQAQLAIEEADVIIFLMDGREGLTPADETVSDMLRKTKKPVHYAVNKIDGESHEEAGYDFYRLGIENLHTISAEHKRGIDGLMSDIVAEFPEAEDVQEEGLVRISIIGRPNVGKSSLVNRLLGEKRLLVSDVPGTTRDSVNTLLERDDKKYLLIDTAGIRRKSKVSERLEKYTIVKALCSIDRTDVVILVIDAQEGVTEQDEKVAGFAHEKGKGCVIVVNKWDLIEKDDTTIGKYVDRIRIDLKYMSYAPIIFISALTGQRVVKVLDIVDEVVAQASKRVSTSELNRVIEEAARRHHPPSYQNKFVKLYFGTQIASKPPTFVVFTNHPEGIHFSYSRYIENKIRQAFGFEGTPFRLLFKERSGRKKKR